MQPELKLAYVVQAGFKHTEIFLPQPARAEITGMDHHTQLVTCSGSRYNRKIEMHKEKKDKKQIFKK